MANDNQDNSSNEASAQSGGGAGTVPAWSNPDIVLSSLDGIAALTPKDAILSAGNVLSMIAGQDINLLATGNYVTAIKEGLSIFTYGKASNPNKPNQETGIQLHAASGSVSVQAQSDSATLTADKHITLASTQDSINIAAKGHVLMTAGGGYIKLEGGNIEIHAPGMVLFKATAKELAGPQASSPTLPAMPKPDQLKNFIELNYRWDDLQPMVGAPYKVQFDDGTSREGTLDAKGFARLENTPSIGAVVTYGEDSRTAQPRKKQKPNQVAGAKPTNDEEAKAILEKYLAQEDAHYKDNYFPDELDAMGDEPPKEGGTSELEYAFHYDDYKYKDEEDPEEDAAEKSYREMHDQEGESA
jgi:type VI secretion system secreted protein VgrG